MRHHWRALFFTLSPTFFSLLLVSINSCDGQDSALLLSHSMFSKDFGLILIAEANGWLFKSGNDTGWAKKDIDITSWKKLKPTEISDSLADKLGKAEGWFRIKVKPDSSFRGEAIGFNIDSWAATDLYVDGKLILSCGNTGINGKPFQEPRRHINSQVYLNLEAGDVHTIALHFLDYKAPLPPHHLKTEDLSLQNFIIITSSRFIEFLAKTIKEANTYNSIWVSVCVVLSLLFWLLHFQNRNDKNLRLIAISTTCYALGIYFATDQNGIGISYCRFAVGNFANGFFFGLAVLIIPVILANIFERKITRIVKSFLLIAFVAFMITLFLPKDPSLILLAISILSLAVISLYYIVSSWKKLKGAQWIIVGGVLLSLLSILALIASGFLTKDGMPRFYYLLLTSFLLSIPFSLLIYVAMRFKEIMQEVRQNANKIVQLSEEKKEQAINQQKTLQEEVNRQTAEIRATLDQLKSTQLQLIQSEKMASLGELTAGIAHEIQNPLNFVNNFSEVNDELMSDLKSELLAGNTLGAIQLATTIQENERKITQHGKRADGIVKGMLEHSRTDKGEKQLADVNAIAEECLKLSRHNQRAEDRNQEVQISTDLDPSIGKIELVPQDIARVFVNLLNNAFYAVSEKMKEQPNGYAPAVRVTSRKTYADIQITVEDNGIGIPAKVKDKIFQPFFTTKPTGQGTGLGLSLSYDIVKAHGGEISVNTQEGEFTEFAIHLPA
ncbi:MAG TPA: ATP-binding protein [Puia sp.]|nr:ATP-binding protein [Puia sp.]